MMFKINFWNTYNYKLNLRASDNLLGVKKISEF